MIYEELRDNGFLSFFGCVSNKQVEPCCNYFLYTAVAITLAKEQSDAESYNKLYLNMSDMLFMCHKEYSAQIYRNPHSKELCSHDELIGICTMFSGAARTILENMDFLGPWPRYWFGRFPYFRTYVKFCATGSMNIIDKSIFSLWGFFTGLSDKNNASSKQLYWLMCNKMKVKVPWTIRRKYSGPREMFQIYYGNHPITKYAKERW